MKKIMIITILLFVGLLSATNVLNWDYIENERFIVFYPDGYLYQAEEVMRYAANHYKDIKDITGNDSDFKVRFAIQDPGEIPNGNADYVNMKINIFTNDPSSLEDFSNDNWLRILSVHELTHISQLSNTTGFSKVLTTLVGNIISLSDAIPMWIVEGITVFNESSLTPYEGRMNYGYYPAIVSAKAAAGKLPNLAQAHYWSDDYPGGQYYVYGGSFFRFLSEKYGDESIGEFFRKNGKKFWGKTSIVFPFTALDISAKQAFGKTLPKLFKEWQRYETEKAVDWHLAGNELDIHQKDSSSITRTHLYNGKIYFVRTIANHLNYYYELVRINEGESEILESFPGGLIGNLEFHEDKLYYALQEAKSGFENFEQNGFGIVGVLYEMDINTGKSKKILKADFKDFTIENNGDILLASQRKDSFGSTISRWNGKLTPLFNTSRLISELLLIDDTFYCVDKSITGSWDISELDMNSGKTSPIVNSAWQETRLKQEGNNLAFTANYDSQYGVYNYDVTTKKIHSLVQSSFAADGVRLGDDIYYTAVTANGERIYKAEINKQEYTKELPENFALPETEVKYNKEGNAFWKNLKYLFIPSSRFNPKSISGMDGIGFNSYSVSNEYNKANGFSSNITWSTSLFNPVSISLAANGVFTDDMNYSLNGNVPLYQSQRKGLSAVSLNFFTDFQEANLPGLVIGFGGAKSSLYSSVNYDIATEGYTADATLSRNFRNFITSLSGRYIHNSDAIPTIKASDFDVIDSAEGYEAEAAIGFRLLKIRTGLWNPNIAFGDVNSSLYVQHSNLDKAITAYGAEARLDVGIMWFVNLTLVGGVNYVEDNLEYYYKIDSGF